MSEQTKIRPGDTLLIVGDKRWPCGVLGRIFHVPYADGISECCPQVVIQLRDGEDQFQYIVNLEFVKDVFHPGIWAMVR